MPIVEKISQMQKQGIKNEEIVQRLREEGISPREIGEALDQSAVKSAVYANGGRMEPSGMESGIMESVPEGGMPVPLPGKEFLEQTMAFKQSPQEFPQMSQEFPQMPQEMPETTFPPTQFQEMPETTFPPTQFQEMPQPSAQELESGFTEGQFAESYPSQIGYPQPSGYQTPEYQYQEYQYPAQTMPIDTEMITEVAEQIIDEKLQKTEKQISEISKIKTEMQGKINNTEERIKRIEMMMDRLQVSILREIGNYGKNVSELKEEMQATQDSFSKILSPLSENLKELRKITGEKTGAKTSIETTKKNTIESDKTDKKPVTKTASKPKDFENYLRD